MSRDYERKQDELHLAIIHEAVSRMDAVRQSAFLGAAIHVVRSMELALDLGRVQRMEGEC